MEGPTLGPHDDWDVHWDDYAEATQHNPAQWYRRRLILRRLGKRPARVLDVGSGQGDLVKDIVTEFGDTEVVGVEGSQSGVEASIRKAPSAVFVRRDLLDPSTSPGPYGGWATNAVCSEVLEHVDDPVALLRNSLVYMAPGCRVIVTVPGGPMSAFDHHIGHRRHYSPESLRCVLQEAGFIVEDIARAGFPFFNVYRFTIIARGKKLVDDVSSGRGTMSGVGLVVMRMFRILFTLNLDETRWGWQLVATARSPELPR
jgi:SAM-dependent methyltransferase